MKPYFVTYINFSSRLDFEYFADLFDPFCLPIFNNLNNKLILLKFLSHTLNSIFWENLGIMAQMHNVISVG